MSTPPAFAQCHLNALGIVCSLGAGKTMVAERLFRGETGTQQIEKAVVDGSRLPFSAVTEPLPEVPQSLQRFASRNLSLALLALKEIDDDIRCAINRFGTDRVAVVMGTSTSGISVGEDALAYQALSEDNSFPQGFDFLQQEIGSVAESIATLYELTSPAITLSTACSSSAKAFATARRLLRQNLADAVIVGGCDSRCRLTLNGFHSLSALSRDRCLPFSANRDGTTIGEGAAVFIMSRDRIGPQVCGLGESSDAHNMTAPHPEGAGAVSAMIAALADACVRAEEVNYVNLHGTATQLNDTMEARALQRVFAHNVLCSSSKGQIGHTLGAAGAIETAICWLTLEHNPQQRLPPHVWDGASDSGAPLPGLVRDQDRLPRSPRQFLMSNSYAFGGSNMCVLLGSNNEQ